MDGERERVREREKAVYRQKERRKDKNMHKLNALCTERRREREKNEEI